MGGNSNDYNYPNNPVDGSDLTGLANGWPLPPKAKGIYELHFTNGKVYVGRSVNMRSRVQKWSRSKTRFLNKDGSKATLKSVSYQITDNATIDEQKVAEQQDINYNRSIGNELYNARDEILHGASLGTGTEDTRFKTLLTENEAALEYDLRLMFEMDQK